MFSSTRAMVGQPVELVYETSRRWHLDRISLSLAQISQRLRGIWAAQNLTNRMLAGTIGVLFLVGVAYFSFTRFRSPDYGVLFASLPADDASAVITKLKDAKIPFRLQNNGTTILVPQENLAEERVALAGDGVVKGGGAGFELFDRTNFGMTDFQEKIAKQRATEGELQRTIAGLTPVESARVHIASPESSLYSSTQQPTTASVAIKTKPGMTVGPTEVRGITLLVADAVEGLKPENVTIVNQDGNILVPSATDPTDIAATAANALKMTQDQLVAKQRYETNVQENIQGFLDAAVGQHRAVARVNADMLFDAASTESKTYGQGSVLSSQTEKESAVGYPAPRGAAAGVPGTTTNAVPTYQGTQNQQNNGRYNRSKSTINNQVPETIAKHIDAPGKITRLSVAVLVNVPGAGAPPAAGAPAAAGGIAPAPVYALAPADVAKIRNVVAAAAGIDPARGDQISVEAIPFAPPVAVANAGSTSTVFGIPTTGLLVILGALALVGIGSLFAMRRRGAGAGADFRPSMDMPSFDSSLAEELPSFEEHPMLDGTPGIAAPIRSAADLTREQMIEYVTTVAQENPDSIAKLVKLWLAE
jgi:flagellar M-ring protein FliF